MKNRTNTKSYYRRLLSLFLILITLFNLMSCTDYDDIIYDFYMDTSDGEYNAIKLDFGENNYGIYYIEKNYGIWSLNENQNLFGFEYQPRTQRGGTLDINIATKYSYYQSIIEQNNGFASFYLGETVFRGGKLEFTDNNTIAKLAPDLLYVNEMSIPSGYTVVMTKTKIIESEIIPFETAINNMNFVPDEYFIFISDSASAQYELNHANLYINGATMTGEWKMNGVVIPIRMEMNSKVPYIVIYDISTSDPKPILTSYANILSDNTIELINPTGSVFYAVPEDPIILTKTN